MVQLKQAGAAGRDANGKSRDEGVRTARFPVAAHRPRAGRRAGGGVRLRRGRAPRRAAAPARPAAVAAQASQVIGRAKFIGALLLIRSRRWSAPARACRGVRAERAAAAAAVRRPAHAEAFRRAEPASAFARAAGPTPPDAAWAALAGRRRRCARLRVVVRSRCEASGRRCAAARRRHGAGRSAHHPHRGRCGNRGVLRERLAASAAARSPSAAAAVVRRVARLASGRRAKGAVCGAARCSTRRHDRAGGRDARRSGATCRAG